MQNPSKTDCIAILSAARELRDGSLISLDPKALGLSRFGMDTAMSFLLERACFTSHQQADGHYAVLDQGRRSLVDWITSGELSAP